MYNIYVVKENDTLDSIAKKFNTPYYEIIRNNNLESTLELKPGQELKMSVDNTSLLQIYRVKKGDTVYGIARKFGVDADVLLTINGLTRNSYIYPNQDLLVPKENISIYVTKTGDSLDSIIRDSKISPEELLSYNEKIYLIPNQVIVHRNKGWN